jgi:hypothetical protein
MWEPVLVDSQAERRVWVVFQVLELPAKPAPRQAPKVLDPALLALEVPLLVAGAMALVVLVGLVVV